MERTGLEPGSDVGGYRIVAPLGSGAMGSVYRALDADGTPVALKVLHPSISANPASRERMRREVSVLGRVRHPGVARVLDAEGDAQEPFIVTEIVEGPTLEDAVKEADPLDSSELYDLADQLRDALVAVHAAGVIHRDLKASNVLLGPDGPVLIDFGISQSVGDARVTDTGLVMGTPAYLAPELVDGADPSEVTDWWGWAAVLAFAATGRAPFGYRPVDVVIARAKAGSPALAGVGDRTAQALAAALAPRPQERLAPDEVVEQLRLARDVGEQLTAAEQRQARTKVTEVASLEPPVSHQEGIDDTATDVPPGGTRVMPASWPPGSPGARVERTPTGEIPVTDPRRPMLPLRAGSALALVLPVLAAAATWPGRALIAVLVALVVLRCVGVCSYTFARRRERRGARPTDVSVAWALFPWHLFRSVGGTVPSLLVAAAAVATIGGFGWWALQHVGVDPASDAYHWVVLFAAAVGVVMLVWGPLTYLVRWGGRVALEATVPRGWPVVVLWVVCVALAILFSSAWVNGHALVWSPFPAPPDLAQVVARPL